MRSGASSDSAGGPAVNADSDGGRSAPRKVERVPLVLRKDIVTLAMFGSIFLIGLIPPTALARLICDGLAWCHATLRGFSTSQRRVSARIVSGSGLPFSARSFQRGRTRETYREIFLLMKHLRGSRTLPPVRLIGAEHVTAGLEQGRGVILWVSVSSSADFVAKMAFHGAGFAVHHLSMFYHGGSASWIGLQVISRARKAVENRYLAERIVLSPADKLRPLRTLQRRLRDNKVVSISAVAGDGGSYPMSLLGGIAPVGRAAPRLAQTTGAVLLPVFTTQNDAGGFDVVIEPPLRGEADGAAGQASLARAYGARLESYLKRDPLPWRGWPDWRPEQR
jgi:lauroyl/myristoyl acyltransferase